MNDVYKDYISSARQTLISELMTMGYEVADLVSKSLGELGDIMDSECSD